MRPVDLARAVGLSTQTVRDYESYGFLPPVKRGSQGYRLYGLEHLHAMRTVRVVIEAFGWEYARRIMQYLHKGDLLAALAVIDARHADIHRNRCEVKETLTILHAMPLALPTITKVDGSSKQRNNLYIGEVARRAGVRVSAVRFWEEQGVIQPVRDDNSRYRLYDEKQASIVQIVALLRKAGYSFATIRIVLTQLATGTPEQAVAAAQNRLKELAEASHRCFEATAVLWGYIEEVVRTKN